MATSHPSAPCNDLTETLIDAYLEVSGQDKKQRERLSAKRRLRARRAIEDYFERKRLERELTDDWLLE